MQIKTTHDLLERLDTFVSHAFFSTWQRIFVACSIGMSVDLWLFFELYHCPSCDFFVVKFPAFVAWVLESIGS